MSAAAGQHTQHNPDETNDPGSQGQGGNEPQELAPDMKPEAPQSERAGEQKPRKPRGFAAMDRKLVSEIARKGGKAAHSAGTAHEFTTEEARVAGRKGGRATHAKRRARLEQAEGTTTPAEPSERAGEHSPHQH
jgi:general stress protein YciG